MEDTLQSVMNALDVIDVLAHESDLTLHDITNQIGTSKTATLRLLLTLQKNGYVTRSDESKRYRLGLKLWELGVSALQGIEAHRIALRHLLWLSQQCEELVNFSVYDGGDTLFLDCVDCRDPSALHVPVATRTPAHCCAAGKVMLAYQPDAEIERYCDRVLVAPTAASIADPDRLKAELAEIRGQGYAVNRGEWHVDGCGVAVPVFDRTGYARAAIGIACPAHRFDSAFVSRVTTPALTHARDISLALGYQESSINWHAIS